MRVSRPFEWRVSGDDEANNTKQRLFVSDHTTSSNLQVETLWEPERDRASMLLYMMRIFYYYLFFFTQ